MAFIAIALDAQGFPPRHVAYMAVDTSRVTILDTSESRLRARRVHAAVCCDLARWMGPGAVLGTFAGTAIHSY